MATGQGTIVFNFGSAPGTNVVTATVTGQTNISSTSKVEIFLMGTDFTATHNAYEHSLLPLECAFSCIGITAGSGFVGQCATRLRLTGTVTGRFVWAD